MSSFDPRLEGYGSYAMRRVMLTATAFGAAIITTLALTGALTTPAEGNDGPPAVMMRDTPRVLPVEYVEPEPVQIADPIGELIQAREALPTPEDVREAEAQRLTLALVGFVEARGDCKGKPQREADACLAMPMFIALNRWKHGGYGETLGKVVFARKQFSGLNQNDPNPRTALEVMTTLTGPEYDAWERSLRVADRVLAGKIKDPTGGALFYHEKSIKPYWAKKMKIVRVVGSHILRMPQKDA